jgi:hypothetical protein
MRRSCVSEAVTGGFSHEECGRSLLRLRGDKADDEDLSRNVGRQARCELERQARIDRLKDGVGHAPSVLLLGESKRDALIGRWCSAPA